MACSSKIALFLSSAGDVVHRTRSITPGALFNGSRGFPPKVPVKAKLLALTQQASEAPMDNDPASLFHAFLSFFKFYEQRIYPHTKEAQNFVYLCKAQRFFGVGVYIN